MNKDKILKLLMAIEEYHGADLSEHQIKLYAKDLERYKVEDLVQGWKYWRARNTKMPFPKDLLESFFTKGLTAHEETIMFIQEIKNAYRWAENREKRKDELKKIRSKYGQIDVSASDIWNGKAKDTYFKVKNAVEASRARIASKMLSKDCLLLEGFDEKKT